MNIKMKKIAWFSSILFFILWCGILFQLFVAAEEPVTSGTLKPTHSSVSSTTSTVFNNNSTTNSTESDLNQVQNSNNHKDNKHLDSILEPSVNNDENLENSENIDNYKNQVFVQIASQNAGIENNVAAGGQPIIVTLSDTATEELQNNVHKQQINTEFSNKTEQVLTNATIILNDNETIRSETLNQTQNGTENEDIPSFNEWAQKQLEQAEKKEQVNSSSKPQTTNNKLRWKNYASLDCGAKVIAANPESVSPGAILSPSRDEYKLNACTNRIWFIVELCESIQAKKIDLANYELFSSSPKDFTVSVSDRFPSRDWSTVGQFTAKDEKDIQSFDLDQQIFGKYIKVEIKSHYGSEHYCPISLFRVYGTSVFEVLQKEDPAHVNRADDDDDDDDETLDADSDDDTPKNLFSSATDAVISMVKKAAQVLGNKSNYTNETIEEKMKLMPLAQVCKTPSHFVVCDNCSEALFAEVYDLLSCKSIQIHNLISIPFIRKAIINSDICQRFGFDLKRKTSNESLNSCSDCIKSFFPVKYLGAMCNFVAVSEFKVVLNVSGNITTDETPEIVLVNESIKEKDIMPEGDLSEPVLLENFESKSSDTNQIKPTKPIEVEMELTATSVEEANDTFNGHSTETVTETPPVVSERNPETNPEIVEHSGEILPEIEPVTENLDDHLDHFIQELNGESTPNPTASPVQPQKESVFLRLSNRIKALERNMSLSSQYLEELSKRYKKQVEEMQRLLEKTIAMYREKDQKKEEHYKQLEERIDKLTLAVEGLLAERSSFTSFCCWLFFIGCILAGFLFYIRRREPFRMKHPNEVHRRKSIDIIMHESNAKKRRPSDQALKIVRASTHDDSSMDDKRGIKRKKKRKTTLQRSNSINTLSEDGGKNSDWIANSVQVLEDTPYVLEESEHSILEPLPQLEAEERLRDGVNKIDVPDFVQTAAMVRLNRAASHNGPMQLKVELPQRKSNSVDETVRRHRKSLSLSSTNGNGSINNGVADYETPKKERKGFKKLLKKVF